MGAKRTKNGFKWSSTAEQVTEGIDGNGLTAIVTGGTNGIGKETVRVLAKRGVHVFVAARNLEAAEKVKDGLLKEMPEAKVDVLKLDLCSFESVRKAADDFLALNLPLNILVNNAGIMGIPFQLSEDGIEKQFATNYLGPFLLTNLLLEKLKTTAKESGIEGKVVNVSSGLHHMFEYEGGIRFDKLNDKDGYNQDKAYGQSKLAQVLTTKELSRSLEEEGANVTVNVLHPGVIKTNLINSNHPLFKRAITFLPIGVTGGDALSGVEGPDYLCTNPMCDAALYGTAFFLGSPFMKSIPQGAATTCFLALNPLANGVTGKYFYDSNEAETPSKFVKDTDLAKRLWDFSIQLTTA